MQEISSFGLFSLLSSFFFLASACMHMQLVEVRAPCIPAKSSSKAVFWERSATLHDPGALQQVLRA
jgi:hypothetical protein